MAKIRLDQLLVERELAENRDQAKRLIMAGLVLVGDEKIEKAGTAVRADCPIRLKNHGKRFAGRGGLKLKAALEHFSPRVKGVVALDLGASTGGFTDCLLQHGAARVYAVDVGTNQLVYSLRTDPRVVCLERTHAKKLCPALIPEKIDFLTVDVSFTSLRYVLPFAKPLLAPSARAVVLVKPQFEVGRERVKPGGLVDEEDANAVTRDMARWFENDGIRVLGTLECPVKGRDGNREFLFYLGFEPA